MFKITRQAHYKAVKALEKEGLSEELILDWVKEKRKVNKSEGGRKLFCRFDNEFKGIAKIGRDKFFTLLRNNDLLIKRKKSFTRTTDSNHSYWKYKNQVRSLSITRKNQVWASDITYLGRDKISSRKRKLRKNAHFRSQICTFASDNSERSLAIQNNVPQSIPLISKSLPVYLQLNGNNLLLNKIVRKRKNESVICCEVTQLSSLLQADAGVTH